MVGTKVRSYARKYIRCDDCTKYSTCNNCLGTTENGFYDVEALRATPTEVAYPCSHCFADSRNGSETCQACNRPRDADRLCQSQAARAVQQILKECPATAALIPKVYYLVNDCLSCS